jgi:hypothetical protein
MQLSKLLIQKTKYKNIIIRELNLLRKNKSLWLIDIKKWEVLENLIEWLSKLPVNFVILVDNKNFTNTKNIHFLNKISLEKKVWFDFIVGDDDIDSLENYFKYWVVPIVSSNNYLSSLLKEFDAKASSWNAFLYEDMDSYSVFYALIRYLENKKFPYDNKALVKNLVWEI